ncbi:hypothetical protein CRG98_001661 [Punica granatum]|uniref:Uncharacterized protein n=1 Tax=Punica granatum TaxID=22663 RepID=A0A2I0LBJ9_PUNGR|nr:hypothetical protein CRG98_001661 [Punica granatum]
MDLRDLRTLDLRIRFSLKMASSSEPSCWSPPLPLPPSMVVAKERRRSRHGEGAAAELGSLETLTAGRERTEEERERDAATEILDIVLRRAISAAAFNYPPTTIRLQSPPYMAGGAPPETIGPISLKGPAHIPLWADQ